MENGKVIPGFRFHPTDMELLKYFLKKKVTGKKLPNVIAELDVYGYCPQDLPGKSHLKSGDQEWYFFCPREKKYSIGRWTNRATKNGYWKATGKDKAIVQHDNKQTVGMMKTLVFHTGKAPCGLRTGWFMHEYRLQDKHLTDKGIAQDSYVICKVFQKELAGPRTRSRAQYEKPFNDDDDDDDHFDEASVSIQTIPFDGSSEIETITISSGSESVDTSPVPPTPSSDTSIRSVKEDNVNNSTVLDLSKEEKTLPKENIAGDDSLSKFFEGLGDLESEYTPNGLGLDDFAPNGINDDDLEYLELLDLDFF
ncbi:hypothetical protein PIB30_012866 [Stylosanthes scabra]|uniref:NAC domain-containing protein n=1 Tax=Stylosanthes scabra TaxID=79078 RepID=A0ABU6W5V5_9FABA|nr:hypothetical protein [Stylosanthes scabra]